MRTLLILLTSFLVLGICDAQADRNDKNNGIYRTYYLPDGAILKGRIIGKLAKDSLIVETHDGLVYHLSSTEVKQSGKIFAPPGSASAIDETFETETTPEPAIPVSKQPKFAKGSSQLSADLMTHFSSGGTLENTDPESGIVASVSYLYSVIPQLKVGGGVGIMTVKSGSKERIFPVYARGEYQLRPRLSASVSAGYSFIPTNDFVLVSKNGVFSNATLAFDLVGPESAYTSRIGLGMVMQQIELGRSEIIREGGFGNPRTYTQYVERSGWLRRIQITFTHAWRMPPATSTKRGKSKRKKR